MLPPLYCHLTSDPWIAASLRASLLTMQGRAYSVRWFRDAGRYMRAQLKQFTSKQL
ncbi:hypothetical protein AGMMS49545_12980 [Betaproteobacteria bacterium]|nr:hypothetical protein AGMMS49545_12980 [Betaproteobacteria bacterium]GHU45367.1 hypothetical protein AGMMS50289_16450 [Betaproteobacteria bacterium]